MKVKVYKLRDKHIPDLWEIVKTYPGFFSDDAPIKTLDDFTKWFKETNKGALIGFAGSEFIGCCFLDNIHNNFGSLNIIFKKHFNSALKLILSKRGLKYFFHTYHLKFIYGITRINNYPCIALMKKLGFVFNEVIEGYKIVNGKKTDYVLGGVLYARRL